jgi:fluoroacetyl-CoA thioesterase
MKPTLIPGLAGSFRYVVGEDRTVPAIFPDAPDFQMMPAVLATGYLVALCEWACIELVKPHLDWPAEQSLGTRVELTHTAATPPGLTVTVHTRLTAVEGRKLSFALSVEDGVEQVSSGTHERHVIAAARFTDKLRAKRVA